MKKVIFKDVYDFLDTVFSHPLKFNFLFTEVTKYFENKNVKGKDLLDLVLNPDWKLFNYIDNDYDFIIEMFNKANIYVLNIDYDDTAIEIEYTSDLKEIFHQDLKERIKNFIKTGGKLTDLINMYVEEVSNEN